MSTTGAAGMDSRRNGAARGLGRGRVGLRVTKRRKGVREGRRMIGVETAGVSSAMDDGGGSTPDCSVDCDDKGGEDLSPDFLSSPS